MDVQPTVKALVSRTGLTDRPKERVICITEGPIGNASLSVALKAARANLANGNAFHPVFILEMVHVKHYSDRSDELSLEPADALQTKNLVGVCEWKQRCERWGM